MQRYFNYLIVENEDDALNSYYSMGNIVQRHIERVYANALDNSQRKFFYVEYHTALDYWEIKEVAKEELLKRISQEINYQKDFYEKVKLM